VFSAPATSGAHILTRPRDGPPIQAVRPQRSAPASQPGPHSVDRHERVGQSVRQNMVARHSSTTLTLPVTSRERPRPSLAASPASQAAQPVIPPYSPPVDVPPPPELPPLLRGDIVLPHRIICHSERAQNLMERLKISWGVQYELARGVLAGRWTWDDATIDVLKQLCGPNAHAAPRVNAIMSGAVSGATGRSTATAPHTDSSMTNLDTW
jgi:hypothetical protein